MADMSDELTLTQSMSLMDVAHRDNWHETQLAAYMIAAKSGIIATVSTSLTNLQKISMFNALAKVPATHVHRTMFTLTHLDAVRRLHG